MSPSQERLDHLLVQQGLAADTESAMRLILAGQVYLGTNCVTKPGMKLSSTSELTLRNRHDHPWVSRAGVKLMHGIEYFRWDVQDKICLDIGCSTGGFTEVLLTKGAAKVYAIDVGYGELDWRLRNDPRVILHERTNARFLSTQQVPEKLDCIVCDVSFISLKKVLPPALQLVKSPASLIALIKPQFELPREAVGEGGIVRDEAKHHSICQEIQEWMLTQPGWNVIGITPSPLKGVKGNQEFLLGAQFHGSA